MFCEPTLILYCPPCSQSAIFRQREGSSTVRSSGVPRINCLIPMPSDYHRHFWTEFTASDGASCVPTRFSWSVLESCIFSRRLSPPLKVCFGSLNTHPRQLWMLVLESNKQNIAEMHRWILGGDKQELVLGLNFTKETSSLVGGSDWTHGLFSEVTSPPSPPNFPQMLRFSPFSVHLWNGNICFYKITITFSHLLKFIIIS